MYKDLTPEQVLDVLNQPIPEKQLKTIPKGGKNLHYVPVHHVVKMLNDMFQFGWDFEVVVVGEHKATIKAKDGTEYGKLDIVVKGKLTIRYWNGAKTIKEQFGGANLKKNQDVEDVYKSAGSSALVKCASYLNIGLGLNLGKIDAKYPDTFTGEINPKLAELSLRVTLIRGIAGYIKNSVYDVELENTEKKLKFMSKLLCCPLESLKDIGKIEQLDIIKLSMIFARLESAYKRTGETLTLDMVIEEILEKGDKALAIKQ